LMAYTVARRTRELGIRIALGAAPRQILRLVVGHALGVTLSGIGLGLVLAFGATQLMASVVYDVDVRDPLTFAATVATLAAVAALASYPPARRATRIDPIISLRSE